ncbi:hypothetical protein EJ05DRAFT_471590 [Pseudovirgaria hyperparasitica]|uniref:Uncharacterized protein n=1 Tax=Pseudovirgaria hyperparasitica TaxID=470096 RepID=A0A6A6WKA5_9PEZI|nr:uncharacterized protein EJ05DRAFT_471590 [Pseudovirgaria hyperparasitica]KAF2762607.1 hypothetical protein EJ05DRAFT_471590 [Pseudovirgaria hyperparasitica]
MPPSGSFFRRQSASSITSVQSAASSSFSGLSMNSNDSRRSISGAYGPNNLPPTEDMSSSNNMTERPAAITRQQLPLRQDNIKNWSIYVVLSHRSRTSSMHWSIFVPTGVPYGTVWQVAKNKQGLWHLDTRQVHHLVTSRSLAVMYEIGTVNNQTFRSLHNILSTVPVGANPGEYFDSRVWVRRALSMMQVNRFTSIDSAVDTVNRCQMSVSTGSHGANIINIIPVVRRLQRQDSVGFVGSSGSGGIQFGY